MIALLFAVAEATPGLVLPARPAPVAGDPFLDTLALHFRLDGQVVDQESLSVRYDEVCAAGRKLACSWRAWDDQGRVRPAELARLADPICGKGDLVVCVAQAWALGLGDGGWNGPAPEAAGPRLITACGKQVRRACTELGTLVAAHPIDAPDPIALHGHACALGEPVGCLRAAAIAPSPEVAAAFRARAGEVPTAEAGCAAGFVAACETLVAQETGPSRIGTLEQLCHRSPERWCPELGEALAATDVAMSAVEEAPDATWFGERAVLLGWFGPTFLEHGLVRYADLRWVELRQGLDEVIDQVVLVGADREWILPPTDCAGVSAAAARLVAGGVSVRAVADDGGPTRSQCLDRAGPTRPAYHGGRIVVDPRVPADDGPATARKAELDAASAPLFACLGADLSPEDPLVAQVVHRSGTASKVKLTSASRDPAFDTCALAWLAATDLGVNDVPIRYVVRIELW